MPERFSSFLKKYENAIVGSWVDAIYTDRRTELPLLLSSQQLLDHIPELLDALGEVLDGAASERHIAEVVQRLRFHAQVRFQQGCLIDEVARELMLLRTVLNDFLWREGISATEGDIWELRDALGRTNIFFDEMLAQAIVVYATNFRPPLQTRAVQWPPRRRTDSPRR